MATLEAAAVLEQTKIVWPSGRALAATSAAMAPLAPGLFSTTAGTPNRRFRPSAMVRAPWSVAEPAPNGTMMRNGPLGKLIAGGARARPTGAHGPRPKVHPRHQPRLGFSGGASITGTAGGSGCGAEATIGGAEGSGGGAGGAISTLSGGAGSNGACSTGMWWS